METGFSKLSSKVTLRRILGRWDLTAVGINQVIGSGIFLLPSLVTAQVGAWSVMAFVLAGLASMLVALCFAEVGSRFKETGGPYLYTRAAFGRFVGFEVGWMQWITRVTSWASVANGIPLALGFYVPAVTAGVYRTVFIVALFLILAAINYRGIQQAAWTVNLFTISKLVPLIVFIAVGLFFIQAEPFTRLTPISWSQGSTAALLLIFAFGGFDVIPVPSGESSNPRDQVPFAMISAVSGVTLVMLLAHVVALGTLPGLAQSETPLADSAFLFMGTSGAILIGVGAVISMIGNNAGQVLTGSRMLFALSENGDLPHVLARIHPRFQTPSTSILVTTGLSLGLALSGSFVVLATASAVARLVVYAGVGAATLRLRKSRFVGVLPTAKFRTPFGAIVPILAIGVSMIILFGASREQLIAGFGALLIGAVVFVLNNRLPISASR